MAQKHPLPEINVTPLVDVVLVLLIIFMVVTPALANEDRVALPTVDHPDDPKSAPAEPIEVVLTRDGRFFLDRRELSEAALGRELAARKEAEPARRLLLLSDGRLPYAQARSAFAKLSALGFRGVSLKVLAREREGG